MFWFFFGGEGWCFLLFGFFCLVGVFVIVLIFYVFIPFMFLELETQHIIKKL